MARISPLLTQHQQAEAHFAPYGPAESPISVVQTFGEADIEYAAIRKSALLLDLPQRAVLQLLGADRHDFLNRMLTQELKGLPLWRAVRSFWLSRKGRIDADLRVINLPDRVLLELDAHSVQPTLETLGAYIITENVVLTDLAESTHRLALHGPKAHTVLARVARTMTGEPMPPLAPDHTTIVTIGDHEVIVDRADTTGEAGLELIVPFEATREIYDQLLESGNGEIRPGGWAAFNVARIEAGTAIFFIDFGPDSLPHETSQNSTRVSFTKGCYLGQEIVARMQSLGAPKQRLVGLRLPTPHTPIIADATQEYELPIAPQPITGAAIFDAAAAPVGSTPTPSQLGDPIGAITSSAISPMLGGTPICFAMVKNKHTQPNTSLLVECEGSLLPASVQATLRFWSRS